MPVLAVIGLIREVPIEIVIGSLILVAMAVIGMTATTQDLAAGRWLLAWSRRRDPRPSSGRLHRIPVCLPARSRRHSFYQEWRLVLAGFVYVAGFQIFNFLVMYRDAYVHAMGWRISGCHLCSWP